jgi:two-component system sensor histidine kinase KdpD
MRARASSLLLRAEPPSRLAGVVVAMLGVAAITVVIFPLRSVSPPVSNGVLYLLVVLLVSTVWGLWLGLLTSVISLAAFNFFHIPPTGRFSIAEAENWVALLVFLVAAVVASTLSDLASTRARDAERRRREADLAAELAQLLLGSPEPHKALGTAAKRIADTLEIDSATVVLERAPGDERQAAVPLGDLGTLLVPVAAEQVARERVAPALTALLAAALERELLIREVVETNALRRSDEIKTALLRAVSHDLRSPLTAIMTAGEALGSTSLSDDERTELASSVSDQARRLSGLVDKLLDFSRLQAGGAEPRSGWVSLEEVIHVAAEEQRAAGVEVSEAIDPDLPLVRADAAQLERALANLLENAARYSHGHPVIVRSKAVGSRILIRVVDRGPGIPAAELDRIFEPFQRGGREGDGAPAGTGLGLAIVKALIEANGAKVWAESSGSGTTFVIAFPLPARAGEPVPA